MNDYFSLNNREQTSLKDCFVPTFDVFCKIACNQYFTFLFFIPFEGKRNQNHFEIISYSTPLHIDFFEKKITPRDD